nr:hypothetical protein GCM10020093_118170 [Planobispora longispora]
MDSVGNMPKWDIRLGVRFPHRGRSRPGAEIGWWAMTHPRVLVIDDEQDVLDLLTRHLGGLGCQVRTANTGELGLSLAVRDPPDLVVLDVRLPGVDGREVTRALRADPRTRDCRIIITSVLDMEDLVDIHADAVLPKPFRRADVKKPWTHCGGSTMATVLVAEDDSDIRDLIVFKLEQTGHTVIAVGDGSAALRLARERTPTSCCSTS